MKPRSRNQFDLRAADAADLIQRIDQLRAALRARNGTILEIQWRDDPLRATYAASILYEIPALPAAGAGTGP